MKNNVVLVIGDNASGKTRYLKQLRKDYLNMDFSVVSNFYNLQYEVDPVKVNTVLEEEICYMEETLTKKSTIVDTYLQNLLQIMTNVGDVLIIDGLDRKLSLQAILDFCIVLSQLRDSWEKIIVSGYNSALLRLFTYFVYDLDGYTQRKEALVNMLYLADVGVQKVTDWGTAHECFNKIRG